MPPRCSGWLAGSGDRLIVSAIGRYGSDMTQARVSVDAIKIAPADGKGCIEHLVIGNPAGFRTAYALKASRIELELDPASLVRDVVRIRRIAIEASAVIYEKGKATTNFAALRKNIAAYLGPGDRAKNDPGKKLIVEEFTVCNITAEASAAFISGRTVRVGLPDITLKNIGTAKSGGDPGELGQIPVHALESKLIGRIDFRQLMPPAGKALDKADATVKGLFK